jgi:hypothetical protein
MFMPRPIASLVDHIARLTIGKEWTTYAGLLEHWPEIVGEEYARLTTPVKIAFPHQPTEPRRRNGILTIRLPKGLTMEFTFKTPQIKQRVNLYFGYAAIGKIAFDPVSHGVQKPASIPPMSGASAPEIQKVVEIIDNRDLRQALQGFGEAIAQNDRLK